MDILPRRLSNYYIITIIFAPVVVISANTGESPSRGV